MNEKKPMTNGETKARARMWPSFETAATVYDWANWLFLGALVIGAISSWVIIWMGGVKEGYFRRDISLLTQDTEILRKENLRLEAELSPRKMRGEQMQAVANSLSSFKGRAVRVESYALDVESAFLAQQLMASFTAAGLNVENNILSASPMGGLALAIHVTGTDKEFVAALLKSLAEDGGLLDTPEPVPPGSGMFMPSSKAADAVVFIGARPPKP